jgi:hypothetical protein
MTPVEMRSIDISSREHGQPYATHHSDSDESTSDLVNPQVYVERHGLHFLSHVIHQYHA